MFIDTNGNGLMGLKQWYLSRFDKNYKEILAKVKECGRLKKDVFSLNDYFGYKELPQELFSLKHLKTLVLIAPSGKNKIVPVEIQNLGNLEELQLYGYVDLTALENLKTLKNLSLFSETKDFSFLFKLNALRNLHIVPHPFIKDFSFLGQMTDLEELTLQRIRHKSIDFSFIDKMSGLKSFTLTDSNRLTDFSAFSSFHRLDTLDLSSNSIEDVSFLSSLKGLKKLILSNNNIHTIEPLVDLPLLEELDLSNNNISYVSTVMKNALGKIKIVNLSGNSLK